MRQALGVLLAFAACTIAGSAARSAPLPPPNPLPSLNNPELLQRRADAIAAGRSYAFLLINETLYDLSGGIVRRSGGNESALSIDQDFGAAHGEMNVLMRGGPAAFISFGTTTQNLVAGTVTYSFLFGTPITNDQYTAATSTGGVSLTNGLSGVATVDPSQIYPTYISGYGRLGGGTPTNLNVDIGNTQVLASGAPFQVTTTQSFGPAGSSFAPTNYDSLEALVTYNQTGDRSTVSWTGAITLDIPEPAALAALSAAAAIAVARRRRRES